MIVDDEPAARAQLRDVITTIDGLEVIAEIGDGTAAVEAIKDAAPDIVFLDIDMPGVDGFGVAESTNTLNYQLVFVTAHHQHALRAFETHAIDYLLKPARPSTVERCLEKILRQEVLTLDGLSNAESRNSLVLTDSGTSRVVDADHISFIEGLGRYRRIHLSEQGAAVHDLETLLSDTTLDDFTRRLSQDSFLRVHRSYLVNLSHVLRVTTTGRRSELVLEGLKTAIPVARSKVRALKSRLG